MRVMVNCLLATGPQVGGGFTFLTGLLRALCAVDAENEYILLVSEANRKHFTFDAANFGTLVIRGPVHRALPRLLAENLWVPRLAATRHVDVFFSPNDSLPPGLRCKTIVAVQNILYFHPPHFAIWSGLPLRQRLRLRLQRSYYLTRTPAAMLRADRILAISYETRRQVLESIPGASENRIDVVYPGVGGWAGGRGPGAPLPASDDPPGEPFFLSVSSITPYKNIELLLSGFAEFVRQGVGSHRLIIVGRAQHAAYQRSLEQHAHRLGIANRVEFRGFATSEELRKLYGTATGFLLVSSCESFGFPVVEALACGAPVVVSNVSTPPELVGDAGILVEPGSSAAVTEAMIRLAIDSGLRARLSTAGAARARQFQWRTAAARFIGVLETLHLDAPVVNELGSSA
ncbi:N/A [soil metagenome]